MEGQPLEVVGQIEGIKGHGGWSVEWVAHTIRRTIADESEIIVKSHEKTMLIEKRFVLSNFLSL